MGKNRDFSKFPNAITVLDNGNVGIGATSIPSQNGGALSGSAIINGIMRIQGVSGRYFQSGDGLEMSKTSIYSYNRDTSSYNDLGLNDSIYIKGAGNVGIGTGSPSSKLHLYDGTNPISLKIQRTSVPVYLSDVQIAGTTAGAVWSHNLESTSNGSLTWGGFANTNYSGSAIMLNSSTSNSWVSIFTASASNTNPSERVRIDGSGNVGIGTTSPSYKLSVANELQVGAQGGSDFTYIGGGSGVGSIFRNYYSNGGINNEMRGNGNNYFNTVTGNFGIGTNNPGFKTDIANGVHEVLRVTNSGSANGNNPTMQVLNQYGNHSWGITAEFRVNANGGTDRPSILFSNGYDSNTWACGFGYADSGYFRINKDQGPYASSWGTTLFSLDRSGNYSFAGSNVSDRRNKKDISYITESQIDTILKLKPATFVKKSPGKDEYSEYVHTGFIAQDILEEGIPNLVHGNEADGYGLDYDGLFTLAVKAIQELKIEKDAEIAHLKTILNNNGITI